VLARARKHQQETKLLVDSEYEDKNILYSHINYIIKAVKDIKKITKMMKRTGDVMFALLSLFRKSSNKTADAHTLPRLWLSSW
jgi:hypothetical protein